MNTHILSRLVVVFTALTAVFCAPTNDVKVASLIHQNALDAQTLNGEFQRMKDTDPCNSGQTACIDNAPAQCKFGSWQLGRCPSRQTSCYALPRPNAQGTFLACVSDSEAQSFFDQAGVTGGPVNDSPNASSVVLPTQAASSLPSSASVSQSNNNTTSPPSVVTVTVTVPANFNSKTSASSTSTSTSTSTLVTTLGAAEALGVLQSALANGAVVVSPPYTPTPAPSHSHSHSHSCTSSQSESDPRETISFSHRAEQGEGYSRRERHLRRATRRSYL